LHQGKTGKVFFSAWTKEIKKQQTWAFGKPGDRTNNEIFQPEGYIMLHRNIRKIETSHSSPNHQMWWYHPSTEVRSADVTSMKTPCGRKWWIPLK